MAAGSSYLLHGVWWHLRHGRNRAWRWLRPRDLDSAVHAPAMEPADGLHDRRTFQRAPSRRRLLRLGTAWPWKLLGISGGLAFSSCKYFRYGHLSHAVRGLLDADCTLVPRRAPWCHGRPVCGDRLRRSELGRNPGGGTYLVVAVLSPFDALCGHRFAFSPEIGSCRERAPCAGYLYRGIARGHAHRGP